MAKALHPAEAFLGIRGKANVMWNKKDESARNVTSERAMTAETTSAWLPAKFDVDCRWTNLECRGKGELERGHLTLHLM